MSKVKSPLRYLGGKSKALSQIMPYVPPNFGEYREPLVGGGSVFLAIKQLFNNRVKSYWINDLNHDLYCFWESARDDIEALVGKVTEIKQKYKNGRELFEHFTRADLKLSEFERAVRFFVLNRGFANIIEWTLQYGMNNYKQEFAAKGKELMIKNY